MLMLVSPFFPFKELLLVLIGKKPGLILRAKERSRAGGERTRRGKFRALKQYAYRVYSKDMRRLGTLRLIHLSSKVNEGLPANEILLGIEIGGGL
jgi:hypothetical protein